MFSYINVRQVPREIDMFKPRTTDLVVIEGHLISHVYMDEVLRSVVLPFVRKPVTVPGLE